MSDKENKIQVLLNRAQDMADERLSVRIAALEAVKTKSTANCAEYKSLLKAVNVIASEGADTTQDVQVVPENDEAKEGDSDIDSDIDSGGDNIDPNSMGTDEPIAVEIPSKYYMFIRMYGFMYRSDLDGYKKDFPSADDCARYFYDINEG